MVKLKCCHYGGDRFVRNGLTQNGKQRYLCSDCGRMSRDDSQASGYTEEEREYSAPITSAAVCVVCLAPLASPETLSLVGLKKAALPELGETLCEPDPAEAVVLELDELCSRGLTSAGSGSPCAALRAKWSLTYYATARTRLVRSCRRRYPRLTAAVTAPGGISTRYPGQAAHGSGQAERFDGARRAIGPDAAAAARALRQEESVIFQVQHDARVVSAALSGRLQ